MPSSEESAVKTLDSILATLNPVEFEIDIALGIGVYRNVNDSAIFLVALSSNIVLEFFDPGFAFFPGALISRHWN